MIWDIALGIVLGCFLLLAISVVLYVIGIVIYLAWAIVSVWWDDMTTPSIKPK